LVAWQPPESITRDEIVGGSGWPRIAADRATVSSRAMLSGGCQALGPRAMFMRASWFSACSFPFLCNCTASFFRQHQAGIGLGPQRHGSPKRQVGVAIEQARNFGFSALELGLDRRAR